jgi:Domain of unknown function (DUF4283)
MNTYPSPPNRPPYSYVHIPANQIYQYLQNEVNNTIRMEAISVEHVWTVNGIRRHMLRKYGGSFDDYKVKMFTSRAILLALPPWLSREIVLRENMEWAEHSGLNMTAYKDETRTFTIPRTYMVRLRITQYPLALWHQSFFSLALASMGEIVEVHEVNESRGERAFLRVWIHCKDPNRISECLILDVEDKWVTCPVEVETWYPMGPAPPGEPPAPPDEGSQSDEPTPSQPNGRSTSTMVQLLLQCHARWVQYNTSRSAAPAASDSTVEHEVKKEEMTESSRVKGNRPIHQVHTTKKLPNDQRIIPQTQHNGLNLSTINIKHSLPRDTKTSFQLPCLHIAQRSNKTDVIKVGSVELLLENNLKEKAGPCTYQKMQGTTVHLYGDDQLPEDKEQTIMGWMGQSKMPKTRQCRGIKCCTIQKGLLESKETQAVTVRRTIVRGTVHKDPSTKVFATKEISSNRPEKNSRQQKGNADTEKELLIGSILINAQLLVGSIPLISQQPLDHHSELVPRKIIYPRSTTGPIKLGRNLGTVNGDGTSSKGVGKHECRPQSEVYLKQTNSSQETQAYNPISKLKETSSRQNSKMNITDDELIAQFTTLQTEGSEETEELELPTQAYTSINWAHCAVARVVSDRTIMDAQFKSTMTRVWQLQPTSSVRPIARNTYLVQFSSINEMCEVVTKGIWTYRNDVVALKQAYSSMDLTTEYVQLFEIWVQLHNIPAAAVTHEGIWHVMSSIGTPMTEVQTAYTNGKHTYRARLIMPIDKPLKDRVTIKHPELGRLTALIVYERVNRACLFCGLLGHEINNCQSRLRLARLKIEGTYDHLPQMNNILEPKFAPWIVDASMVPAPSHSSQNKNQQPKNPNKNKHTNHAPNQQSHEKEGYGQQGYPTHSTTDPNLNQRPNTEGKMQTQTKQTNQAPPQQGRTTPFDLNDHIPPVQSYQPMSNPIKNLPNLKRQKPSEDLNSPETDQSGHEEQIVELMRKQATLQGTSNIPQNPKRVKAADPKRPLVNK